MVRSLGPGNVVLIPLQSRDPPGEDTGAACSCPLPPPLPAQCPAPVGDTVPCHRKEHGPPCPHHAPTHQGAGPGCRIPLWPPPAWSRRATGRVTSSVTSHTARSGLGSPAAWRERGRIRDLSRTTCADSRQPQSRAAAGTGTPWHRSPRGTRNPPQWHCPLKGPVSRRSPGATAGAAPCWRLRHSRVRATRGRDGRAGEPWHRLCHQVQPPQNTGPPSAAPAQPHPCPQAPLHTGTGTAVRDVCKVPHCSPRPLGTPVFLHVL